MGSSKSNTPANTTCQSYRRYAPYVEAFHSEHLRKMHVAIVDVQDNPPNIDNIQLDVNEAFFGIGYLITSYPALYDVFGKSMAGLDIENVWDKLFSNHLGIDEIDATTEAEVDNEEITIKRSISEYSILAREINTVCSSSFTIDKANIEAENVRASMNYKANLIYAQLDDSIYGVHINWSKKQVTDYATYMKYYYIAKETQDKQYYKWRERTVLWPITTQDFMTESLGMVSGGARDYLKLIGKRERSWLSKNLVVMSSAISYAFTGFAVGGWMGAAIGAQVGTALGEAQVLSESGSKYWYVPYIMGPEMAWFLDMI